MRFVCDCDCCDVWLQIIRDMRRPSTHYITRGRLRFRFAQVLFNAVALLAIAGGLAAYFRGRYCLATSLASTVRLYIDVITLDI